MENNYDIAIVGGGIVGVATAYQLQKRYRSKKIVLFEKENQLATHQTGRNSGVIHSGLYYKTGSQKALNCVQGRKQLIKFAKDHNISHDICGKLVVATNDKEASRLQELKSNGEANGLVGLEILDYKLLKDIEPYINGIKALLVPEAGIIDYKEVTFKLAEQVKLINNKSNIITSCLVKDYKNSLIMTNKGVFNADNIIFCGGLFSDRLAIKDKADIKLQIVGFRGDYYKFVTKSRYKINNLVYPVPNPAFPFLGVHFTRMINGEIECGPNAVFTFKREGYRKTDFDFRDTIKALSFSGTRKLFINNWKFGLNEYKRAFSKSLFLKELNKMMPSLKMDDIIEARSGVRAMALSPAGDIIDDFKILRVRGNIHVVNAPSPAATACLAIGEYIVNEAKEHFNL